MKIVLIGGTIDVKLRLNQPPDVEYLSYADICARARAELNWLIQTLTELPIKNRLVFK